MVTTARVTDRIQKANNIKQAATATGRETFRALVVACNVASRVKGEPVRPTKLMSGTRRSGSKSCSRACRAASMLACWRDPKTPTTRMISCSPGWVGSWCRVSRTWIGS